MLKVRFSVMFLILFLGFSPLAFSKEAKFSFSGDREINSISNLKQIESSSTYINRRVSELEEAFKSLREELSSVVDESVEGINAVIVERKFKTLEKKIDEIAADFEQLRSAVISEDLVQRAVQSAISYEKEVAEAEKTKLLARITKLEEKIFPTVKEEPKAQAKIIDVNNKELK